MSPLFVSEFCAALAPGRIELTRRGAGFGRRTRPWRCANFEAARDEKDCWQFALIALQSLLLGEPPVRGRLRVVLSGHWVRYLLVPWNADIRSPDEFALYARACFERVHGQAAADWEIRADSAGAGLPRLACAVDKALLQGLDALARETACKLSGVQPYLTHAFNPLRSTPRRGNFLFVLAEPGRATLLSAERGRWRSVRNCALAGEALATIIEREHSLLDLGSGSETLIHATGFDAGLPSDCAERGWRLVGTGASADYSMALGTEAA